jgi:hypothetical protein
METTDVLKKLQKARAHIKGLNLKKQGRNAYSNYDYYTPEQVNSLVNDASEKFSLFNKFDLERTELGLMARLEITDLETGNSIKFTIATEIPEIKATNVAQQLGGAVTYSNRYLLMIAYDIVENALDFDDKDHTKVTKPRSKPTDKEDTRPWLSEKQLAQIIDRIRKNDPGTEADSIDEFVTKVFDTYRMKKVYREQIEAEMGDDFNERVRS